MILYMNCVITFSQHCTHWCPILYRTNELCWTGWTSSQWYCFRKTFSVTFGIVVRLGSYTWIINYWRGCGDTHTGGRVAVALKGTTGNGAKVAQWCGHLLPIATWFLCRALPCFEEILSQYFRTNVARTMTLHSITYLLMLHKQGRGHHTHDEWIM